MAFEEEKPIKKLKPQETHQNTPLLTGVHQELGVEMDHWLEKRKNDVSQLILCRNARKNAH